MKKDDEWYFKFVEDATYQQRAGDEENVPDHVQWYREQFRLRNYDKIIESVGNKQTPYSPWIATYHAMSLAAIGKLEESVGPILRGIKIAKEELSKDIEKQMYAAVVAKLYNLLGVRLHAIDKDDEVAEHYYLKGWCLCKDGRSAWPNVINACEMKLLRALDGRLNLSDAINEVNVLMDELFANFKSYENDQNFISYVYRNIGLEPWRTYKDGLYFKQKFGHLKPK
jgi:hypothetical protein